MKLKLFGLTTAGLSLLATTLTAQAADIPRPIYKGPHPVVAYYNWTGFYVGIVAGYGWGTSTWEALPGTTISPKGYMIGGTLGYNYQTGSFVWGIEGDLSWSNVKGSVTCGVAFTCETSNSYLATLRGRLGYAFDRFMPYVTGGLAAGDINATRPGLPGGSNSSAGWVLGVGLEVGVVSNVSVKAEYLYVDLGNFNCGLNCGLVATGNTSFDANLFRGGLNVRF